MDWARILSYVTGTVEQDLLGRDEYLAAENRIMKAQPKGRLPVSSGLDIKNRSRGHHHQQRPFGAGLKAILSELTLIGS